MTSESRSNALLLYSPMQEFLESASGCFQYVFEWHHSAYLADRYVIRSPEISRSCSIDNPQGSMAADSLQTARRSPPETRTSAGNSRMRSHTAVCKTQGRCQEPWMDLKACCSFGAPLTAISCLQSNSKVDESSSKLDHLSSGKGLSRRLLPG